MHALFFLFPGLVFGAAEFFLTKAITDRVTGGKLPALLIVLKIVSYAAVLVPVFLLLAREKSIWFGVGAGGGVLLGGLGYFVFTILQKKR